MISPGSHSAAFLAHMSGLWVAIRRASRHLSFFCVSTQVVMLYSAFFHQLLSRFLFEYSLLGLLCCLHQHRMKYCCLGRIHHVCCLLLEYPRLFRRHGCLLNYFFVRMMSRGILRWVRSIFFVFFCCSPRPSTVHYCRRDNNVEQV